MKKLSIVTILSLCVFVCISTANAVPITYSISGVMQPDIGAPVGTPEFYLEFSVDSNKPPVDTWYQPGFVNRAEYIPDNWSATIGSEPYIVPSGSFRFWKDLSDDEDTFEVFTDGLKMIGSSEFDDLEMEIVLRLPGCTLGDDVPVRPSVGLDTSSLLPTSEGYFLIQHDDVRKAWTLDKLTVTSELASSSVPEPTTEILVALGLVGLAGFGRKRFKK